MTKFAVKNPVTILVLAALMLLAGAMAYVSLPRESFPEIKIPLIFVNTVYPGASPQDIEKLVIRQTQTGKGNLTPFLECGHFMSALRLSIRWTCS